MADDRWCRACGADPVPPGPACPECATALDPPDFGAARVGRVVLRGSRLLARPAVAVEERDGTVLIRDKEPELVPLRAGEFDRLPTVPIDDAGAAGAPGRLWAVALARGTGALKARWTADEVSAIADRLAGAGLGTRRGAAVDVAVMGRPRRPGLRLSGSEWAWYEARAAALTGDLATLLARLRALPAQGYRARVGLLLFRVADLRRDPAAAAEAMALLDPFAAASPDARALLAVLGPDHARALPVLREYARRAGTGAAVADAIHAAAPPLDAGAGAGPRVRALAAYLHGVHDRTAVDPAILRLLPLALIDRLVTTGAVTAVPPDVPLPDTVRAHLRSRLQPGDADDATLARAGFTAERARRAYVRGDDETLGRLPGDHEAVRHYRALRAYARTGHLHEEELRPSTQRALGLADGLSLNFPVTRPAPAEVAADPSTWPRFQANVIAGKVVVPDDVRARHPQFGLWADLCRMHALLQAGRWNDTVTAGGPVARDAADARTRAAALNLMAYAEWQRGRADRAAALLDEALALHPAAGLAVNAALVAEDRGAPAALPLLARVMQLTGDARLRRAALVRALELGRAADAGEQAPATLTAMVRGALALPGLDDDLRYELLHLTLAGDRGWLLEQRPSPQPMVRYFQLRAALEPRRTTRALADAAAGLAAAWPAGARPPWLVAERSWLQGVLIELVEQDLDPAADPLPAIATITERDVLEPNLRIQLAAAAGRQRISASGRLPRDLEELVVFTPVRRYRQGLASDPTTAAVLANCLAKAMAAGINEGEDFLGLVAREWKELDRTTPMTWTENQAYVARRLALLDEFERRHLQRCRRYPGLAAGLPVDERLLGQVGERLEHWAFMIKRLRGYLA
ncbi:hypothetical protein [Dactylosporangium sp. NPDC049140]|uniref:hypothetical protein n=1 Tax=Dactylosporangium sp. NPDC049140 TaxID=3155647 RepID=UPI0033C9AA04